MAKIQIYQVANYKQNMFSSFLSKAPMIRGAVSRMLISYQANRCNCRAYTYEYFLCKDDSQKLNTNG